MAGIYIHIPFCKKACHYCNFHFSTSTYLQKDFLTALLKEIQLQQNYLSETVSTIYFGGGTPSILPFGDIESIIQLLNRTFTIEQDAEVTLEANPDDISSTKLHDWKAIGINRLSIGIQSFFEDDLIWMNRAHNAQQASDCITLAQSAGFNNLSVDLIYGAPTLHDNNWKHNVEKVIDLRIPHLSCYALTVEPKTTLEKMIAQKKIATVEPEKQAIHFEMLMQWMNEAGYEHYEISNFSKRGYRSKHNSSYWQAKPYLGLGPSAHSFNGNSRQWNIANNALYVQSLHKDVIPYEIEILNADQQFNEYIMTSLRTMEGLSLQKVTNKFGELRTQELLESAQTYIQHRTLKLENDYLQTTIKGKLMADGIASDLFRI